MIDPNIQTNFCLDVLLKSIEERQCSIYQLKWTLGIVGIAFFYFSGNQIKSWLSNQTKDVTTESINDPEFKVKVSEISAEVAKNVLSNLMKQEELQGELKDYIQTVLKDSVLEIFNDEEFQEKTKDMVEEILSSDQIINKTKDSVKRLLLDQGLRSAFADTMRYSAIVGFMPTYFHPELERNYINEFE